ncbi:MAG TPA: hypothetical protein VFP36_13155, partial [Usitatibacter sp.]|nr:hypothetical protein [Usitatibacter sp.]
GAPAVVSNASSLPEVAGSAARLVAPDDVEGWAQAMLALAADRAARDALAAASREQAARFDRHASAGRLLDLYEEALREPKLHTARTAA